MQATSEPAGLPAPTGRHGVGRASFELVDPNRAEIYSTNPKDRRELVVWAWYPATPDPDAERAAYLPEPWAPSGQLLGLDAAGLLSHAVAEAPLADERSSYPVLVQSQSGFPPLLLAAIAEELASHGYVVVGVNHTYESAVTVFADGRVVAVNPDAQAGVLGPQTGPYQERFRWCRDDRRCRAAANLDGALWTEVGRVGLDRPALQLLAEHPEFARSGADAVTAGMATDAAAYDTERSITFGGWRTVHERARPGYTMQVTGATHVSFMDVGLLPLPAEGPVQAMLATTSIDPRRMRRVTCDVLLAFFGAHLEHQPVPPLLEGPRDDYPELRYGAP